MTNETHIPTPSLDRVPEVCTALESNQRKSAICVDDFFEEFVRDIAQYQVPHDNNFNVSVDKINESIEALLAPRDAALEVVSRIIRFVESDESARVLRRLFESLYRLTLPKIDVRRNEYEADSIRFFINEMFIYAVSIALKHEKFDFVAKLLDSPFYIESSEDLHMDDPRVDYGSFSMRSKSLENRRSDIGSVQADYLKNRCNSRFSTFRELLQADFVLHLCGELRNNKSRLVFWWLNTWPHQDPHWLQHPYEIFVRAESDEYFRRMVPLFSGVEGVRTLIQRIQSGEDSFSKTLSGANIRSYQFTPLVLMNHEALIKRL